DRLLKAVGNVPQEAGIGNDTTIRPKLHLKSQFYASREFVEGVLPRPERSHILLLTLHARIEERRESIERLPTDSPSFANRPTSLGQLPTLSTYLKARTESQIVAQTLYF